MTTKKNIYQKLLVIQQAINGLGKDKKSNNYSYVTGDKLLGFVKPLMNEQGLLLKQEILDIENTRQDYKTGIGTSYEKDKSEILSKVMMRFTWVDTETGEKDENLFGANGQNDWEKGLGSALTYAERYFLLKFFHIATDEDDIDNPDRTTKQPAIAKPVEKVTPAKVTIPPATVQTNTGKGIGAAGGAMQPNTNFDKKEVDPAKVKALEMFNALDKPTVLKYLIKDAKMKHISIEAFVEAEPIEKIREIYTKLTVK